MFSKRPEPSDPLSEVVRLLRPRAALANVISGKGDWAVRFSEYGLPSFCIVLEGSSRLAVDGHQPITIAAGDFVLLPTTPAFTMAKAAALSRSAFFDRFTRTVGVAPMVYLLGWRMELAKELLRDDDTAVSEVAERVGYGSTSSFSVAFSRHVGVPPSRYVRSLAS